MGKFSTGKHTFISFISDFIKYLQFSVVETEKNAQHTTRWNGKQAWRSCLTTEGIC
jgi:hypothetical protein